MRRKKNQKLLAVLLAAGLSVAPASAMGAEPADFSDIVTGEFEVERPLFEAGKEDGFFAGEASSEDICEESGEEFVDSTEKIVSEDGMEYQYSTETDSYILIKGKNTKRTFIPKEVCGKRVSEIGRGAFADCTGLECVTAQGALKVAGGAFRNCPRLLEFITVDIWSSAETYWYEFAVDSFDPDARVVVLCYADYYWEELDAAGILVLNLENEVYHESNGIIYAEKADGVYAVGYDDSAALTVMTDYINVIRRKSFYGCGNLRELVVKGNNLRTIETKAFEACPMLEKITIPASVTEISADAFEGSKKVVIYAPKGSYAESYARQYHLTFVPTDEKGQTSETVLGRPQISPSSILMAEMRLGMKIKKEIKGADGYDFVLGEKKDFITNGEISLRKSKQIVPGVSFDLSNEWYFEYAACRAWKITDGKKIYGPWSKVQKLEPDDLGQLDRMRTKAPVIRSVKVNGNKVTVNLSATSYPSGFYCVMGTKHDAERSWNLKYKKKDQKSKTITFTNVKKGTYYIGARSYKELYIKLYGPWSGMKKITVK